jgi:hypothetical protein
VLRGLGHDLGRRANRRIEADWLAFGKGEDALRHVVFGFVRFVEHVIRLTRLAAFGKAAVVSSSSYRGRRSHSVNSILSVSLQLQLTNETAA